MNKNREKQILKKDKNKIRIIRNLVKNNKIKKKSWKDDYMYFKLKKK